jgi:hypothetical protein
MSLLTKHTKAMFVVSQKVHRHEIGGSSQAELGRARYIFGNLGAKPSSVSVETQHTEAKFIIS